MACFTVNVNRLLVIRLYRKYKTLANIKPQARTMTSSSDITDKKDSTNFVADKSTYKPSYPDKIIEASDSKTFDEIVSSFRVYENFVTEDEETALFDEVEPHLKRLKYEASHWDDAIHGYRETEKKHWTARNKAVIQRIRELAFPPDTPQLSFVHVLDVRASGLIRPHVDSVRVKMPATNKNKVQQLTLSKYVTNASKLSSSVTALPLIPSTLLSGITRRRSRAEVVLNDELLLQIKKGLEISVGNKSKVKVKRLSGGTKPQISKSTVLTKQSPVKRGRPKKSVVRVNATDSAKLMVSTDKRKSSVMMKSDSLRWSSDNVSGSLLQTPSIVRQSQSKKALMENAVGSKLSPKYEKEKLSSESSNVYNLRSKSEIPLSIEITPSSSTNPEASESENHSISPHIFYSVPAPDFKADVILNDGNKKRKRSDSTLPKSKMRRSDFEVQVQTSWTELKPKTRKSIKQFAEDIEQFETPRQTSRQRKSVIGISNELNHISKMSVTHTAPGSSSTIADSIDKEPRVIVTRIGNGARPSFSTVDTPLVHTEEAISSKITYNIETSSKKRKTDEDYINEVFKTPKLASNDVPVSSVAKPRVSGRERSAAKTLLSENVHSKIKSTQITSKDDVDGMNFDVTDNLNEAEIIISTDTLVQSISKSSLECGSSNGSSSVSDTESHASYEPKSRLQSRFCQSLLLFGLPIAVATYTYCVSFGGLPRWSTESAH